MKGVEWRGAVMVELPLGIKESLRTFLWSLVLALRLVFDLDLDLENTGRGLEAPVFGLDHENRALALASSLALRVQFLASTFKTQALALRTMTYPWFLPWPLAPGLAREER